MLVYEYSRFYHLLVVPPTLLRRLLAFSFLYFFVVVPYGRVLLATSLPSYYNMATQWLVTSTNTHT